MSNENLQALQVCNWRTAEGQYIAARHQYQVESLQSCRSIFSRFSANFTTRCAACKARANEPFLPCSYSKRASHFFFQPRSAPSFFPVLYSLASAFLPRLFLPLWASSRSCCHFYPLLNSQIISSEIQPSYAAISQIRSPYVRQKTAALSLCLYYYTLRAPIYLYTAKGKVVARWDGEILEEE